MSWPIETAIWRDGIAISGGKQTLYYYDNYRVFKLTHTAMCSTVELATGKGCDDENLSRHLWGGGVHNADYSGLQF